MANIRVSTVIEAAPDAVWNAVRVVEDHVEWMADAEEIRFLGSERSGVGTSFECDTRIGPVKLTDTMEITEWEDQRVIGVAHTGLVTGSGRFRLVPAGPDRTEFVWEEELDFPTWMGGPLRNPVGGRLLEFIWRRNLRRLKAIVETSTHSKA